MSSGIHEIIINIESNIPEKPTFELTSDVYYVPDDKEPGKYNKYPFFTVNMRFPKSLRSKTQKQLKELFFIKDEFESDINGELAVNDEDRQSNATYNMKLLLELLMPTSFPIENNYTFSFDKNILGTKTSFQEAKTWTSYLVGSKPRFSYVKIGDAIYSFIDITWVNDIVNVTEYRQLFRKLNQYATNSGDDSLTSIPNNEKLMTELKTKFAIEYNDFFTKLNEKSKRDKSKTNTQTVLEEIIKANSATSNRRQIGIPPDEMNPLLEDLEEISATSVSEMIGIFFKLVKLELNAKKGSQQTTFIPQQLESLPKFRSLMNIVKKYNYLDVLNQSLKNLGEFMKIVNKKKDDMSNQWEVYVQSQFKNMKEVIGIVDMMKKYRKPTSKDKPKLTNYQYITNTHLQSLINDFGQGSAGNQLEDIAKELGQVLLSKSKKVPLENSNTFEVGIIIRTQSSKTSGEKDTKQDVDVFGIDKKVTYHVSLQVDFVKGELTSEVVKDIKCPYSNNALIDMYDTLKNSKKNLYLVHKKQPLIDINSMAEQTKQSKANKTKKREGKMKVGGFIPKKTNRSASTSKETNRSASIHKETKIRKTRKKKRTKTLSDT